MIYQQIVIVNSKYTCAHFDISFNVFAARLPVRARFGYFVTKQNCLLGSYVSEAKILFCASLFLQQTWRHLLTGVQLSKPDPEQTNAYAFQLLEIE